MRTKLRCVHRDDVFRSHVNRAGQGRRARIRRLAIGLGMALTATLVASPLCTEVRANSQRVKAGTVKASGGWRTVKTEYVGFDDAKPRAERKRRAAKSTRKTKATTTRTSTESWSEPTAAKKARVSGKAETPRLKAVWTTVPESKKAATAPKPPAIVGRTMLPALPMPPNEITIKPDTTPKAVPAAVQPEFTPPPLQPEADAAPIVPAPREQESVPPQRVASLGPPSGTPTEAPRLVALTALRPMEEKPFLFHGKSIPPCIPKSLKRALADVVANFGPVTITSTHRSRSHNRRVGGASRSLHLSCQAIDFKVSGARRKVVAFLRKHSGVGGLILYRSHIHIDTGPRYTQYARRRR